MWLAMGQPTGQLKWSILRGLLASVDKTWELLYDEPHFGHAIDVLCGKASKALMVFSMSLFVASKAH